jgi:hypothetical protein
MLLSKIYVGLYIFYGIFGYNCVHRYIHNYPIDIVSFNPISYRFICKRTCMLSLISLLHSSYFLNNTSIVTLFDTILINSVVVIGYYTKWKIDEPVTFYMHVFWCFPAIMCADYSKITYKELQNYTIIYDNMYMIYFLCCYYYIQEYIYTKKLPLIDSPV